MSRRSGPTGAFATALEKLVADAINAHISSDGFRQMLETETAKKVAVYVTHEFTNGGHLWNRVGHEIAEHMEEVDLEPLVESCIANNLPRLVEETAKKMLSTRVSDELTRLRDAGRL